MSSLVDVRLKFPFGGSSLMLDLRGVNISTDAAGPYTKELIQLRNSIKADTPTLVLIYLDHATRITSAQYIRAMKDFSDSVEYNAKITLLGVLLLPNAVDLEDFDMQLAGASYAIANGVVFCGDYHQRSTLSNWKTIDRYANGWVFAFTKPPKDNNGIINFLPHIPTTEVGMINPRLTNAQLEGYFTPCLTNQKPTPNWAEKFMNTLNLWVSKLR